MAFQRHGVVLSREDPLAPKRNYVMVWLKTHQLLTVFLGKRASGRRYRADMKRVSRALRADQNIDRVRWYRKLPSWVFRVCLDSIRPV